jgi:hypothetical protein
LKKDVMRKGSTSLVGGVVKRKGCAVQTFLFDEQEVKTVSHIRRRNKQDIDV